jgi:hypothetical protein
MIVPSNAARIEGIDSAQDVAIGASLPLIRSDGNRNRLVIVQALAAWQ